MKALLLSVVVLAGCANGVSMSEEERIACRSEGCAVFTEAELRTLGGRIGEAAYQKGWADAHKQNGRDI